VSGEGSSVICPSMSSQFVIRNSSLSKLICRNCENISPRVIDGEACGVRSLEAVMKLGIGSKGGPEGRRKMARGERFLRAPGSEARSKEPLGERNILCRLFGALFSFAIAGGSLRSSQLFSSTLVQISFFALSNSSQQKPSFLRFIEAVPAETPMPFTFL